MKKQETIKTNDDVLNIVYVINDDLEYETNDQGIVTILIKQDHKIQKFFRRLKAKIPEYKKIELDEKSSFVFNLIDGKRTIKEIGELVDEKFKEQAHPLYENLLLFLNHIEVNSKYISKK
ncbi:hypothetical protein OKW22_000368 [Bacilli bacterium PM5-3]|nr:hypothetical protein [Bacilli bacterium PM5-3]